MKINHKDLSKNWIIKNIVELEQWQDAYNVPTVQRWNELNQLTKAQLKATLIRRIQMLEI